MDEQPLKSTCRSCGVDIIREPDHWDHVATLADGQTSYPYWKCRTGAGTVAGPANVETPNIHGPV